MTTMRTMHHLAASGGTMMAKAVAATQNVYLLSEINPAAVRGVYFNPMDPFQQAVAQYAQSLGFDSRDIIQAFLNRLEPVERRVGEAGGYLVLRDHAHSDWVVGQPRGDSVLVEIVKRYYRHVPIVTLRNPVETYASLLRYGWQHGKSFDKFCSILRRFLDYFGEAPLFHYEDFVRDPDGVLQAMLTALELPYDPDWGARYPDIKLTGDSGRGRQEGAIRPLPMREISAEFRAEVMASDNYLALCQAYGYYRDPEEQRQARAAELAQTET